jgi:hypothetical protein
VTTDGQIRPARAGEADALTALALRSKAHWGYDAAFMEVVRPILTIEGEPNAEGFYRAIGAVRVGERRSPSGRTLALLEVPTRSPPSRATEIR